VHNMRPQAIDRLADQVDAAVDCDALLGCAAPPGWSP